MPTLNHLRRWLRNWLCHPAKPGPMYFTYLKEIPGMGNRFEATIALPPLADGEAGEVLNRQFAYSVNGAEASVDTFPVENMQRVLGPIIQGDSVHCELRNVDDAGNVSANASTLDFVVVDNMPPAAPGEMSVTLTELPDAQTP